ncbi:hypothetical protein JCM10212_002257 [Sporobolomyces blumeae]
MSSLFATGSATKKATGGYASTARLHSTAPTASSRSHHASSPYAAHPASSSAAGPAAHRLSPDQQTEVHEAFELFDLDKDRKLDYHEFKVALRALGFDLKKAEVLKLMRERSHAGQGDDGGAAGAGNGNGQLTIGLEPFVAIAEELILSRDPLDEIRRAFRLFDEDNSGKISFRNLKKVARELGENLTDDELQAMIEEFDLDQDGEISEHEFISIMSDTS